ncbi:MAG: hypothetical protein WCX73_00405 [Candidatus Pacearchaeota archaeon]|jgi:hypothetical protein
MNFKITKGKVIGTIVISIILNILFWFLYYYSISSTAVAQTNLTRLILNFNNWSYLLLAVVIIYIIWSLFQKKKR